MRKLFVIVLALVTAFPAFSQTTKDNKFNLANAAGDHFMLQLSRDSWSGAADSVNDHIKSFSRGANIYLMINKPFKGSPQFSAAFGIGVGTSSIFLKRMTADIAASTPILPFNIQDTLSHFKKFKVATSYLEIPIELRFTANPNKTGKTFKLALGAKIGTLLNAHTKGKSFEDKDGNTINSAIQKVNSKSYFNTTRLAATARIGYGYLSLFGSYNITTIFKDAVTPDTKLLQIGLTISGL